MGKTIAAPKPTLILNYESFFVEEPPKDRLSLIENVSRTHILSELIGLNYRLKPKNKIYIDESLERQITELRYFTKTDELFDKYSRIASEYSKSETDYAIIFNRASCLFAIEEIVNSERIVEIEDFVMARIEVWEAILKYILAVNFEVTKVKAEEKEEDYTFENLNPKLIPLNELLIETDQIFTPYRGYKLIQHFLGNPKYSKELKEYFEETYSITEDQFIYEILFLYITNKQDNEELDFFYHTEDEDKSIIKKLSDRFRNTDPFKLLSIRKYPFIRQSENAYLLTDNTFLIEKTYTQLLNDFWFDKLKKLKNEKGKAKFNISDYKGAFGYFIEDYLKEILRSTFSRYKYAQLLLFDELKLTTSKGSIELADVYLRYNKRVLLGQVKSGSIYDKEKYGGDVEALYKSDRNKFYENFGVNQLIESIQRVETHIPALDWKFPSGKAYQVYPCIIVSDKAFQTPLMADAFNRRFKELKKGLDTNKVRINNLSLIHISDLELMEESLISKPKVIWDLLRHNLRDKSFVPPFYNTIHHVLERREHPKKIIELFKDLILKVKGNDN